MDTKFSEAQLILKKSAKDFMSKECPMALVREMEKDAKGYPPELWQKIAELGWVGLAIPEEYEGMGYTFQDLTVLLEECGRYLIPAPLAPTVVATLPILDFGSEEQKKEYLPKISRGELVLTPALYEEEGTLGHASIQLKATAKGGDFVLSGTKLFVEWAHVSNYIICAARTKAGSGTDGITVFIVDARSPGVKVEIMPSIARDRQCEVKFDNVTVPKNNVIGAVDKGWAVVEKILEKGAICKCAESIGSMAVAFEKTVAYSKERVQYGRPIGFFQALQHIMADMLIDLTTSQFMTYTAAWMESEGMPCAKEAAMAKAFVSEKYKNVTRWSLRLHGGIGTSDESEVPVYFRRGKSADYAYGNADYHVEQVAQKIGLK
jgi:alkylation response protein AidB-like acyl-CoA dehydrogenase